MTGTVADRHEIAPPPLSKQQRGILVVDDEPAVLQLLEVALRQQGFTVWRAGNGREALDLYQRHESAIELVLLDVQMGGLDGPQTLQALKERFPQVRCCFMSGSTGKYSFEDLMALGALRVLPKPFDLVEMGRTLEEAAGSRPSI